MICQEKTLTNNKLIAEFMGWKYRKEEYHPNEFDWFWFEPDKIVNNRHFELKFHKSWDWLMPVVEKIQYDLGHFVRIERNSTLIFESDERSKIINEPFGYGEQESYIQITYKAVIDFIKWYNKNK